MMGGGFLYWLFQLLALCVMSKYMLSQLCILLDRDAGCMKMMKGHAILFTLFTTVGFACWWGITGASYDADCEWEDYAEDLSDGDPFQVCAGSGATINIVAFAITFLAGVLAIANAFMQNDLIVIKYSDEVPMCCGPKIHFAVTTLVLLLCVALSIVAMTIHWIHYEMDFPGNDEDYDGGLFALKDVDTAGVTVDHYGYECIAVDPCDIDDDTTVCKTFEPLMNAGGLYCMFEIINLMFLVIFLHFLAN